jgi:hypothetical protein
MVKKNKDIHVHSLSSSTNLLKGKKRRRREEEEKKTHLLIRRTFPQLFFPHKTSSASEKKNEKKKKRKKKKKKKGNNVLRVLLYSCYGVSPGFVLIFLFFLILCTSPHPLMMRVVGEPLTWRRDSIWSLITAPCFFSLSLSLLYYIYRSGDERLMKINLFFSFSSSGLNESLKRNTF